MSRQYRIRVYGTQRNNIDPALLAQVVILFGRHLQQQQQQRKPRVAGRNRKMGKGSSSSTPAPQCGLTTSPSEQDTSRTSEDGAAPGGVGEGLS